MQISNYILISIAEAWLLLLALCIFLLMRAKGLTGVVKTLQDRVHQLARELKAAKAAKAAQAKAKETSYSKHLNDQLLLTRQHHLSLDPDHDIEEGLSSEASEEARLAAFRHATLQAEKEAVEASENGTPSWALLNEKLKAIEAFFKIDESSPEEDEGSSATIAAQEEQIRNLEQYRKLFFDMEDKWADANERAESYHQQLLALSGEVQDKEAFNALLDNYQNAYSDLRQSLNEGIEYAHAEPPYFVNPSDSAPENASEELRRLREVAANQHQVIGELKLRIAKAHTLEEKDTIIEDLQKQLEQQVRFVQESETCIKLLEEELENTNSQVRTLQDRLEDVRDDEAKLLKLKSEVTSYSGQNRELLNKLATLEVERDHLTKKLATEGGENASEELEHQLESLKSEYTRLEQRYLQLRTRKDP